MFCCGSMATPEGSGVGQAALLTSTLCSTVKSYGIRDVAALIRDIKREPARRSQHIGRHGRGQLAIAIANAGGRQGNAVEAYSQTRRAVRASESLADDGNQLRGRARHRCRAVEFVTKDIGLVSVMENV